MLTEIERILDEKVRPFLHEHGGDVIIKNYVDGILKIKLIGKCSGCPAAHTTNEELVATEVMQSIPEVKDVILIEDVSDDLINMAYKIINHEVHA